LQADEDRVPSAQELERIVKYPYVEECNLCTVCIPTHLVAHHPTAQARLKARGLEVVQTADPDVKIEVNTKERFHLEQQQQQDRKHKASHQKQPHQQVQPLALRRLLDQRQHNSSTRGHSSKRRLLGATDRSLTDGIYRVKVHAYPAQHGQGNNHAGQLLRP